MADQINEENVHSNLRTDNQQQQQQQRSVRWSATKSSPPRVSGSTPSNNNNNNSGGMTGGQSSAAVNSSAMRGDSYRPNPNLSFTQATPNNNHDKMTPSKRFSSAAKQSSSKTNQSMQQSAHKSGNGGGHHKGGTTNTSLNFNSDNNTVASYYFEGIPNTPYNPSAKKRKNLDKHRHGGGERDGGGKKQQQQQQQSASSFGEREIHNNDDNNNPMDSTFTLGGTAEIASIYGDVNTSVLSVASNASGQSGASASSSEIDLMNVTTLSDTHELSTSNFILNAKMRNLMEERRRTLLVEMKAAAAVEEKQAEVEKEGETSTMYIGEVKDLQGLQVEKKSALEATPFEDEATMTLPDLTLTNLSMFATAEVATNNTTNATTNPNSNDTDDDDSMIEFTSHQKVRTPKGKSRKSELSLLESSAEYSLGLGSPKNISDGTRSAQKYDLSKLIAESSQMMGEESGADEEESRKGQELFVESTASGNDLDAILDMGGVGNSTPMALTMPAPSKVTTAANVTTTTNNNNDSATKSSLCPSPSFVSGKKKLPSLRKSMGDMSKIRMLTASLKKEKADLKKKSVLRMSLPALGSSGLPKRGVEDADKNDVVVDAVASEKGASTTESARKLFSDAPSKSLEDDVSMLSPARNTRRAKKLASSPAKSPTRRSKKSPAKSSPAEAAANANSPARNTRGAKKSPAVDSPARNTRSAKKSPARSPSKASDSPARNTRSASADKKDSPARSLFGPMSPSVFQQLGDSPSDDGNADGKEGNVPGQGPFSGKKRNKSSLNETARSAKRLAMDDGESEHSETLSLSKEFPFLSAVAGSKSAAAAKEDTMSSLDKSPSSSTECGTATFALNELMEDIQGVTSKGDNLNVEIDASFDGDSVYSSAKQSRNKRRETADLNDLMGILSTDSPTDNCSGSENLTPRASTTKTTPKSILNSSNKEDKRGFAKRRVGFGSPEAAEYNIGSPSVSMTPMNPKSVREKYRMPNDPNVGDSNDLSLSASSSMENDSLMHGINNEETAELEDDITRLIARADDPSMMAPIDESRIEDISEASSAGRSALGQIVPGEKTEELETNIFSLVDDNSKEDSVFSLPSVSDNSRDEVTPSKGKEPEDNGLDTSHADMDCEETVELEGNVSALVRGIPSEDTMTMNIEGTMASLLEAAGANGSVLPPDDTGTINIEGTVASLLDTNYDGVSYLKSSQKSRASSKFKSSRNEHTVPLDSNLEDLVGEVNDVKPKTLMGISSHSPQTSAQASDKALSQDEQGAHTMPLDVNMEALLDEADSESQQGNNNSIQFSKEHVSGEDDTVSELGMNTSQELSNNSEVQNSLERIVESVELREPVDVKLDELLQVADYVDIVAQAQDDLFLSALNVASGNPISSIRQESEVVMTQICHDIESQTTHIQPEEQYETIIEAQEDLMRQLQRNLRQKGVNSDDEAQVTNQLKFLLQASNNAVLSEWRSWLSQVASVYNEQLSDGVLQSIENDLEVIADKTSAIDQNREQVALPLLLRSARRATKKNYSRQQVEVAECGNEVRQLEAELEKAEFELEQLQSMHERVRQVARSNEQSKALHKNQSESRHTADSSFYKFFSVEKLHNWILIGSSDSSISLVFRGLSSETNLQASFSISKSDTVFFVATVGQLPRSADALLSGSKHTRFHPAVSGFLANKMALLCKDLKSSRLTTPSEIPSLIHFVELKVARIEQAAKEFDAILGQCKNSFLQPSETLSDGYDFTAYLASESKVGSRLQVTLSLPDCYPFAPLGLHLHSTNSSFDTEAMTRQLKKLIKPGYGALSRAIESIIGLLD
eukprot:scaffold759_cov290-Alexandrium_tamarense.AAC.47